MEKIASKKVNFWIHNLARFQSKLCYYYFCYARVAELVDAADLKSVDRKVVGVQVPPWALFCIKLQMSGNTMKFKD